MSGGSAELSAYRRRLTAPPPHLIGGIKKDPGRSSGSRPGSSMLISCLSTPALTSFDLISALAEPLQKSH